jgi:flagellar hook-length control protein FliK
VLLKPAVQTQAVVAPRRDHNDYPNADFSQTFKDVSNGAHRKVDDPVKPSAQKATRVDQHRQKAETRDTARLDKERMDQEKISRKKVDEKVNKEKVLKESNPKENMRAETANIADRAVENKKSSDKMDALKDSKKAKESSDETVTAISPAAIPENTSPSSAGNILFGENDLAAAVASELVLENSLAKVGSEADAAVVLNAAQANIISADEAQLVAMQSPKVINGKTTVDAEAQAAAASVPTPTTSALKSSASGNTLDQIQGTLEESSDALLNATNSLVTDKAVASSAKEAEAFAKNDAKQIDLIEDPKAVFEKMLQTVSKSVVREEGAPVNPLQNNTAHSSPSLIDSFARFNDAQSPATRGFVVQTAVSVPVGQPQWSQAVGEKVLWLAAQNVSSAEINLHPKDLGPMQVRVSVNQEQTSISFTSHHPMVREVLDQNLNRLRDMCSEQGLNLVNVDVSDKSFSRQQGEGKENQGSSGASASNDEESVTAITTIVPQRLVDHYA